MHAVAVTLLAFVLAPCALAHMEVSYPYPFRSRYDPENNYANIDYSNTSPLLPDGSNFPCKGYQNDANRHVVETYTAGQTYNMTLAGTATHGGGSCQLSLSYDNGKTFQVFKSLIGGCPLTPNFPFTIPSDAPSGQDVLLAWTWFNKIGNREMYMNCILVNIVGTSSATMASYPALFEANIFGSTCNTIDGEEVVFPNPGPQVTYSGDYATTPPTKSDAFAGCPASNGQAGPIVFFNPTSPATSSVPPARTSTRSSTSTSTTASDPASSSSFSSRTLTLTSMSSMTTSSAAPTAQSSFVTLTRTSSSIASAPTDPSASVQPSYPVSPPTTSTTTTRITSSSTSTSPSPPTSTPGSGTSCSEGARQCDSSSKLLICLSNQWYLQPAPGGTICKDGYYVLKPAIAGELHQRNQVLRGRVAVVPLQLWRVGRHGQCRCGHEMHQRANDRLLNRNCFFFNVNSFFLIDRLWCAMKCH